MLGGGLLEVCWRSVGGLLAGKLMVVDKEMLGEGGLVLLMSSCLLERLCHGAVVSEGFGVGRPRVAPPSTSQWDSSCWVLVIGTRTTAVSDVFLLVVRV